MEMQSQEQMCLLSSFCYIFMLECLDFNFINITISMIIKICITLALLQIIFSIKSNQANKIDQIQRTCQLAYKGDEWQQQQYENQLHLNKAKQTFKTPSQLLLYNLFRYKYNFKREYQTFQSLTNPEIQSYTLIFKALLFVFLGIFIFLIVKLIRKIANIECKKIEFINSKVYENVLRIILLASTVMVLLLSVKGYQQGGKSQKTLANLVCKVYQGPKNIIKGGQGPQFNGFDSYISQVQKYQSKFSLNFQSIQQVFTKQYVIKQMIAFGKQMLQYNQSRPNKIDHFHKEMNETIIALESVDQIIPKIQKALKWFNKTLEYSRQLVVMANIGLKTAQKYSSENLTFPTIIQFVGFTIKIIYAFLIVIMGFFIFTMISRRQSKFRFEHSFMEYILIFPILICLLIAYFNSFIIPNIIWSNSVADYLSKGQLYVRNQFNLPLKVRADLVQLLTHIFPVNASDYTTMYYGHLIKNISEFGSIVSPYYQAHPNYFDQLFNKGIQISKQSEDIDFIRLKFLQKNKLVSEVLKYFQNTKLGITEILSTIQPNGQLAVINPSALGGHFREIYKVIRVALFNRIYNARWICGSIGFLLLVSLLCLVFLPKSIDIKNDSLGLQKGHHQSQSLMVDSVN